MRYDWSAHVRPRISSQGRASLRVLILLSVLFTICSPATAQGIVDGAQEFSVYKELSKQHLIREVRKLKFDNKSVASLIVTFTVNKSGKIIKSGMVQSSGDQNIDSGVMHFLNNDLSFDPLPKSFDKDLWKVTVPLKFHPARTTRGA